MAGTGLTGFLQNLTGGEMVIIALVALVVLGPERLPEMARGAGKMLHKVRTMTEGVQSEVRDVMADPSMQPLKELGELAARPRQKLAEYALEAEAEERAKREAAQAEAAEQADRDDQAAETAAHAPDGSESSDDPEAAVGADSVDDVDGTEQSESPDEQSEPATTQEPG